ncbi:MAG: orotidine-5'-phosphate decarboxylase [Candidatus Campbellbacteria bacterium]|nr:orotidine-5'-phosphate decarboxylase [Candidatus Campbellbacteria bacterium]
MSVSEKVIVATDELPLGACLDLARAIGQQVYAFKVHNLYDMDPSIVTQLHKAGARRVWVDAKLHDIPNTVRLRAQAFADAGADIITVHASGGIEMMMAALQSGIPEIFAITVLTSLSEEETHLLHGQPSKAAVLYLARMAKLAGMQGVVCSPKEVGILSKRPELKGLTLVTPGVRSVGKDAGDQQRVDTPLAALNAGASYLVVGRQLTKAPDPVAALAQLEEEIAEVI